MKTTCPKCEGQMKAVDSKPGLIYFEATVPAKDYEAACDWCGGRLDCRACASAYQLQPSGLCASCEAAARGTDPPCEDEGAHAALCWALGHRGGSNFQAALDIIDAWAVEHGLEFRPKEQSDGDPH